MEAKFAGLMLDEEEETILQVPDESNTEGEVGDYQLGCFLTASMIHFSAMKSTMANLWLRGVQIRDLGEKRYLFQFFHIMYLERVIKGSP